MSAAALSLWVAVAAATPDAGTKQAYPQAGVEERLGETVPLDAVVRDSSGNPVRVGELFDGRHPVVFAFLYYRCPTLCGLMLDGLVGSMRQLGLTLGPDYRVATLSVDPSELPSLAAEKKRERMVQLPPGSDEQAWRFLTAEESSIRRLAESMGIQYEYDGEVRQFAHSAVLVVLSPDGKVSRYLYGVRFPSRELKLSLLEAAEGRVGTAFERFLLTCYRYEPAARRYELSIRRFLQGGALLVMFGLAALLGVLWSRELRQERA